MAKDTKRSVGMVHLARRAIPMVVLVAALAAAYIFWQRYDSAPKHVEAPPPPGPIPVHIVTVQPETLPVQPRFLGQTEASQVVELRSRVAGYLQARTFIEGEPVTAGQKVFQIDPRPFEVSLAQAKARLASSQATQERAMQQLTRFRELSERQSATKAELEEWEKEERVAAADVELQRAMIADAELQLGYTSIESPINGMIGRAIKDTGSYVDAGQNGLVAVVQRVDPMYVRYSITEQETLRLRRQIESGQIVAPGIAETEIEITLADGATYPFRGRLNFVDVQVDQTTGTSVVRGEVPNPKGDLKPGQFVYARLLGMQRVSALRVPQGAVLQSPAGPHVYVVNDTGAVDSRPVTLGEWSGEKYWLIEQGVKPGDRVITDRLMMVRPGMTVTVLPGAPATTDVTDPSDAATAGGTK